MKLKSYLWENDITVDQFAAMLEYDVQYVRRVANGGIKAGKKLANKITKLTEGVVNVPVSQKMSSAPKNQTDEKK